MKQVRSACAVLLATLALSAAQSSKYTVGFENKAYDVGDSYSKSEQGNDWSVLWSNGMEDDSAVISTEASASGQRSLKIEYLPGVKDQSQGMWALAGAKTYYLQYKLRFADDFEFNGKRRQETGEGTKNGGKLPGLAGTPNDSTNPCGGCDLCDKGDGFSARLMWRTDGIGELYLYDVNTRPEGNRCGKSYVFSGNKKFKRGAWQTITQKVTVNDPGKSNGSVQVWLDGQQVVDTESREMVGAGEEVDAVFFSTFFGGSNEDWYPTKTQTAFFDSFVVSQSAGDVGL